MKNQPIYLLSIISVLLLIFNIWNLNSFGDEYKVKKREFSMPQESARKINEDCGLDIDCIEKRCEEIYLDDTFFNIRCTATVKKKKKGKIPPKKHEIPNSKWTIHNSTSAMDDSDTVFLKLLAENSIKNWINDTSLPFLIIRCLENKTDVYINTGVSANPELGLYNQFTVRIRFDDKKAFKQRWSESTDGKAMFAPKPIALAREINKSSRMLFQFTPYNSDPQIVEFDVENVEDFLKEVASTCNWKL